jgi:solute carrier family 25 protein 44
VQGEGAEQRAAGVLGGALASVAAQSLTVPIDNVTQRLMIHRSDPTAAAHGRVPTGASVARALFRSAGVRGFYRGFLASLATHTPATAIFWATYFPTKAWLRPHAGLPQRSADCWDRRELGISVLTGALSAALTTCLTNPIDVVRTRMQLTDGPKAPAALRTLWDIVRAEGLAGLRRGMAPRMLSMTVTISLASGGYEAVKRLAAANPRDAKGLLLATRVSA